MTKVTNAFATAELIGEREDLVDPIYNISPTDTPYTSSIDRNRATQTNHEWQTDALDSPAADNAQLEGDTESASAATPTVRLSNQCQIARKVLAVTGTSEAVVKAGRNSELKYQIAKAVQALATDVEASNLAANAKVTRATSTAGELAGVESWIATNSDRGSGGADPTGDGTDVATNGTQRAFTEAQVQNVLKKCFEQGGSPNMILVSPTHKQDFSAFTGNATRYINAMQEELHAAIDVYVSDYGRLGVYPSRLMQGFSGTDTSGIRSALILETDLWAMSTLRPTHMDDLSKTGDAELRAVRIEWTLEARNEAGSGIVADLS